MIAILNMDMPETCDMCPIEGCEYINGKFTCPLIEIEDTEYEWCHECKEYDQEKHCCHRWSRAIRNTIAELEEYYGKYITKHDKTLVIDYPDTDDVQTIIVMDDEGFTRVFEERRSDDD